MKSLKHCLRFMSRLADGIENLQFGMVNPTRKVIDPFLFPISGIFIIRYTTKWYVHPINMEVDTS